MKWVNSLTAVKKVSVGFQLLEKQSCSRKLFFRRSFSMIVFLFILAVFGEQLLVFDRKSAFVLYSDTAELYTVKCPYIPVYTLVNLNKKSAWMDTNHSDAHSTVEKTV